MFTIASQELAARLSKLILKCVWNALQRQMFLQFRKTIGTMLFLTVKSLPLDSIIQTRYRKLSTLLYLFSVQFRCVFFILTQRQTFLTNLTVVICWLQALQDAGPKAGLRVPRKKVDVDGQCNVFEIFVHSNHGARVEKTILVTLIMLSNISPRGEVLIIDFWSERIRCLC